MRSINLKKGFTLIELIVVITIIAVITVVGVVSFTGANVKARDSRRKSDLEKMRIALEVYRQENGHYPVGVGWSADLLNGYVDAIPKDPKNPNYFYSWNGVGLGSSYTYTLYAYMEDLGSTNSPSLAPSCGTVPNSQCNYGVVNP